MNGTSAPLPRGVKRDEEDRARGRAVAPGEAAAGRRLAVRARMQMAADRAAHRRRGPRANATWCSARRSASISTTASSRTAGSTPPRCARSRAAATTNTRWSRPGVQDDAAAGRRLGSGARSRWTPHCDSPVRHAFHHNTRLPCNAVGTALIIAADGEARLVFEDQRRGRNGDRGAEASVDAPAARPTAHHRARARRRRRARLRPYRRDPHADRARHRARHHRRHLDRRGGRRLPRRRPARRLRGLGAPPDPARNPELSRHQPFRQRSDRRRQAAGATGNDARRHGDRGAADPLCHHHDRGRHRSRDLADARPAGRRHARVLRAAGNFPAGRARRALAGGRRAGQSGAGVGGARVRRAARHRGQSQLRHSRPQHHHGRREPRRRAAPRRISAERRGLRGFRRRALLKRQFAGGGAASGHPRP